MLNFVEDDSDEDNLWLVFKYGKIVFRADESENFNKVHFKFNDIDIVCDYIHEIQNLLFELAKKELKFK